MTHNRSAGQGGGIVRTLTRRGYISVLVLSALACLSAAARADTFTLDGAPIDSYSFGTTKTFTVEMATTDAATYYTDIMLGTKIDLLTLDESITAGGTTTEDVLEFTDDVVQKYVYVTSTDEASSDVTFAFEKLTITESTSGNGSGGGGNTVPEPSSAALLASGLLGMVGFGRKKLFN